ncbi:hypothetical protein [Haloplanus natans]|uniref:hypothetical protein n=1 Tax=Haloplanus natans TaxID=376171 RepID=UPI0012FA3053|nr:hypothetical protein [Haloplanus natans]
MSVEDPVDVSVGLDIDDNSLRAVVTKRHELDVDEQVALLWGGWADLETFLDHYHGEASPKAQRREREGVAVTQYVTTSSPSTS